MWDKIFKMLTLSKVMTNLDSILKSRDITLTTKICLVKAMVLPVVMYGCESWTKIGRKGVPDKKNKEHRRPRCEGKEAHSVSGNHK